MPEAKDLKALKLLKWEKDTKMEDFDNAVSRAVLRATIQIRAQLKNNCGEQKHGRGGRRLRKGGPGVGGGPAVLQGEQRQRKNRKEWKECCSTLFKGFFV